MIFQIYIQFLSSCKRQNMPDAIQIYSYKSKYVNYLNTKYLESVFHVPELAKYELHNYYFIFIACYTTH